MQVSVALQSIVHSAERLAEPIGCDLQKEEQIVLVFPNMASTGKGTQRLRKVTGVHAQGLPVPRWIPGRVKREVITIYEIIKDASNKLL